MSSAIQHRYSHTLSPKLLQSTTNCWQAPERTYLPVFSRAGTARNDHAAHLADIARLQGEEVGARCRNARGAHSTVDPSGFPVDPDRSATGGDGKSVDVMRIAVCKSAQACRCAVSRSRAVNVIRQARLQAAASLSVAMRVEDGFCVDLRASTSVAQQSHGLVLIALMQLSSPLGKLPGIR